MIGRRSSALAATVLAFGLQAAYVAPSRAGTELRAASCCADHCPRSDRPRVPAECCDLGPASDEPATGALARVECPPPAFSGPVLSVDPVVVPVVDPGAVSARARAAPIFLVTRSLRI